MTRQLDATEYNGYREGWTDELQNKIYSLLDERAALLERIRVSDLRWRTMSEPIPFDLHKLIRVLFEHGQAVLNLYYMSYHDQNKYDRIVAVLIKDGKSDVAAVTISRDIKSRLENYQLNLQSSKPNPKLYDLSGAFSINAEEIIPSELLSQALQAKQLIIVPHGVLHLVPWAGLSFKGKRLFEYCSIGILPNVSCILAL